MEVATVTKGEFARLINVSAGRVSQYIAEGKLHGPALDGEGRSARIVVDVARQQLRRSLDVGQMIGNGLSTRLAEPSPVSAPAVAKVREDDDLPFPSGTAVEDQIKREKLREIQTRNRRAEEEELERRGIYTRTDEARAGMQRVASRVLNIVEGGLAGLAAELAAKFQLPQRDVLHTLKLEMRKIRQMASAEAARAAGEIPATVDDATVQ